jgi:hypothetical protein
MFGKYPSITNDSLRIMRACSLMSDAGIYTEETTGEVQRFVRCAIHLSKRGDVTREQLYEAADNIRKATGDEARFVTVSHNGEVDYLRLRVESKAYQFLCYLKS